MQNFAVGGPGASFLPFPALTITISSSRGYLLKAEGLHPLAGLDKTLLAFAAPPYSDFSE